MLTAGLSEKKPLPLVAVFFRLPMLADGKVER